VRERECACGVELGFGLISKLSSVQVNMSEELTFVGF
jgi:hypothetical protein